MTDPPAAEEVYVAVRHGVRDALWDVLGTLALVAFAILLFAFGVNVFFFGVSASGTEQFVFIGLGVALLAASAYQLMTALGYQPREIL